ncbi:MAG: ATP-grasp domain-containing protein, partial [Candidatus Omnitrophota bacterium]
MQKVLMILGAGQNEVPAIKRAKEMGIKTIVCDMNNNAPGLEYGDYNVVARTKDPKEYVDIAKKRKINGVMTVSVESLVPTISIIAEELGLTGISKDAASNVTNKVSMKKVLKSHNIPCGTFVSAGSLTEALENVKKLKFPLVIKPADRAGSRGVFKLENEGGLNKYFNISLGESRCKEVIIEEFIEGIEST